MSVGSEPQTRSALFSTKTYIKKWWKELTRRNRIQHRKEIREGEKLLKHFRFLRQRWKRRQRSSDIVS